MKISEAIKGMQFNQKDVDHFLMIFGGHIYFQTMYAAVQFDLFTILDTEGPLTLEQIAEKLDIEIQPARILLLGLVSIKLLDKKKDLYKNSLTATAFFLANNVPDKMEKPHS